MQENQGKKARLATCMKYKKGGILPKFVKKKEENTRPKKGNIRQVSKDDVPHLPSKPVKEKFLTV